MKIIQTFPLRTTHADKNADNTEMGKVPINWIQVGHAQSELH